MKFASPPLFRSVFDTEPPIIQAPMAGMQGSALAVAVCNAGVPARGIVSRLMRELGPMSSEAPEFPLATTAIAPLRVHAESLESDDFSPLWCGQSVIACQEIPAAEFTRKLASPPQKSQATQRQRGCGP